MVGGFITFVVKSYYIYDQYYIYGQFLLHLSLVLHLRFLLYLWVIHVLTSVNQNAIIFIRNIVFYASCLCATAG